MKNKDALLPPQSRHPLLLRASKDIFGGGWVWRIHWTIRVHGQCYVKGGPFDFVPDSPCTTAQRFSIRNISNLCGGERPRYRNGNIWINKHMKKITLSVLSKCSQELPFFSNSWYVFCHLGRFLIGCIDFTNLIRTRRKLIINFKWQREVNKEGCKFVKLQKIDAQIQQATELTCTNHCNDITRISKFKQCICIYCNM